jgi:8-oxo-dGTP pyrophosphatase MutT (NUDIX family)
MKMPIRSSVKIILLNEQNELLLMSAKNSKIRSINGKVNEKFWFLVGGKIEEGETLLSAAIREVFEETGIQKGEVEFGPVVWHGEFDLILDEVRTHLIQSFIVARTKQQKVFLAQPTAWEREVIDEISWFSLEKIKNSKDPIYPILLPKYLPDILLCKYPQNPIEIDLAKDS